MIHKNIFLWSRIKIYSDDNVYDTTIWSYCLVLPYKHWDFPAPKLFLQNYTIWYTLTTRLYFTICGSISNFVEISFTVIPLLCMASIFSRKISFGDFSMLKTSSTDIPRKTRIVTISCMKMASLSIMLLSWYFDGIRMSVPS